MDPLTIARNAHNIRKYLDTVNSPTDVVADAANASIDTAADVSNAVEDVGTFLTDTLPTNFSRGMDVIGDNFSRGARSILHDIAERRKSRRDAAYQEQPFVDVIPVDSQGNPVGSEQEPGLTEELTSQSPVEVLRRKIAEAYPGGGTFSQTGEGFSSRPGASARIAAYNAADTLRRRAAGLRSQANAMEREISQGTRPFWQRGKTDDIRATADTQDKMSGAFSEQFANLSANDSSGGNGAQEAYGKAISSVLPRLIQQSDGTEEGSKLAEKMAHRIALSQLPESMRRTIVPFTYDNEDPTSQLDQAATQLKPEDDSGWGELAGTALGLLGVAGGARWLVGKLGTKAAPFLSKILGKKSPTAISKGVPKLLPSGNNLSLGKAAQPDLGPDIVTRPIAITRRLPAPNQISLGRGERGYSPSDLVDERAFRGGRIAQPDLGPDIVTRPIAIPRKKEGSVKDFWKGEEEELSRLLGRDRKKRPSNKTKKVNKK